MIGRRSLILGGAALALGCAGFPYDSRDARGHLRDLREGLGPACRLGVAAIDTRTGNELLLDADSRYAMCSTFKLPLAAAILAEVERGSIRMGEEIAFTRADLVPYAPVIEANLARGRLSIEALCAAIIEVSDNAAANLLLRRIGGPEGLTAFMRGCGDPATRLDRYETELNSNLPGDPRDTTTPSAMAGLMRTLLLGGVLNPESRVRLIHWMERCTTGLDRLRRGLPDGWRAGDKTGSGANGAYNDIAIAWPPRRPPILIASYLSVPGVEDATRKAAHVSVARIVAGAFA